MEGKDPYKVDDSHEIAAFMRMFMDMVGISENDSIPAGKLTLSSAELFSRHVLTEVSVVVCLYSHDVRNDVWLQSKRRGGVEHRRGR
jgi:hypothetical protein